MTRLATLMIAALVLVACADIPTVNEVNPDAVTKIKGEAGSGPSGGPKVR